jgi:hypothetical protein
VHRRRPTGGGGGKLTPDRARARRDPGPRKAARPEPARSQENAAAQRQNKIQNDSAPAAPGGPELPLGSAQASPRINRLSTTSPPSAAHAVGGVERGASSLRRRIDRPEGACRSKKSKKICLGCEFFLASLAFERMYQFTTHSHVPMALVVMQRRNASFLADPVSVDRSREGGRYGCFRTQGLRALARRNSSDDPSRPRLRRSGRQRTQ